MNRNCTIEANRATCTCTYDPCPRKGSCCECIAYHRTRGEAPACLFTPATERTYDRSLRRLAESTHQ